MLWRSRKRTPPAIPSGYYLPIIVLLLAAKALILYAYGRPPICRCGAISLWQSDPAAPDNSQALADWYSASHLIFGILLFWLMWKTSRHWPTGWLFVSAAASSAVWELVENTPAIVAHFGQTELGRHYQGDSILNSVSDSLFVLAGFALARFSPAPATLATVVALEAAAAFAIRDGLLLSTISFVSPVPEIASWQRGE